MAEGDTIHRLANKLARGLVGTPLTSFELPRSALAGPAPGTLVEAVEARGKHLLIRFADGHVLHTHLRMEGTWHLYSPRERWRRPRRQLRALLITERATAACFNAPVVELLDDGALSRHPVLRQLGPDLCLTDVDLDEVVSRILRFVEEGAPLVDLLLDQRVAAGLGNVYKAEIAFLHGLHPLTRVAAIDEPTRRALFADGARLLQRNLASGRRTTVDGARPGSLWVYDRAGRPCRRCGTPIEVAHLGRDARITYWCPVCQPAPT